jgi:hypothetical protein
LSKVDTIVKHFLNDISVIGRKSLGHQVGSVQGDNKTKGMAWVLGDLRGESHVSVIFIATFLEEV